MFPARDRNDFQPDDEVVVVAVDLSESLKLRTTSYRQARVSREAAPVLVPNTAGLNIPHCRHCHAGRSSCREQVREVS
jgi:hypothetical protein